MTKNQPHLLPSTQIMVCQQILSVIYQLSSWGFDHACWSITFVFDLSKRRYIGPQTGQLQPNSKFGQSWICCGTAGSPLVLTFVLFVLCSDMGTLVWIFLVSGLLGTTALISQSTLQKVWDGVFGSCMFIRFYFNMFKMYNYIVIHNNLYSTKIDFDDSACL